MTTLDQATEQVCRLLVALIESRPHLTCEDCWYSCAAATGDYACCNEGRAPGPCDCGRDAMIEKAHAILETGRSSDVFCPFSDTGNCPGGCPNNRDRACVNGEPS